jgi:hypothetical protein
MLVYKSRFLTRGEVWYDDEPGGARVDWIYHRQRSSPLPGSRWREFYTPLVPLQKTPAELLAGMEVRTARKITEALEKDKLRWERYAPNDVGILDQAEALWNQFAAAQNTPRFERDWVDRMFEAGALDMAAAKDPAGNVLAYHLVYLTPKRARQLVAISPHKAVPSLAWRNAVSRANCFIHWNNFLAYREQGIPCFDFGGWHLGKTDIRLLGINAFKKSFGGDIVREYDCEQLRTVKGWLLLTTARILARLKQAGSVAGSVAGPGSSDPDHAKALKERPVSSPV